MTRLIFVTIVFLLIFPDAACQLVVSSVGSNQVTSIVGENVTLAVNVTGAADPTVAWFMGTVSIVIWTINSATPPVVAENLMKVVRLEPNGSLTLLNVTLSYDSNYTVEMTKPGLSKAVKGFTLTVFERPAGDPVCFVQMVNFSCLQYQCQWPGGTPPANLTFPYFNSTSSGVGNFRLNITDFTNLNGKAVTCIAEHPTGQRTCNVTARSPADCLLAVRSTAESDQAVVSLSCVSGASPKAKVTWRKDGAELANSTEFQMSSDSTQLQIRSGNISNLFHNYSCTCINPLGNKTREVLLQGPSISPSSFVCNKDRTSVLLSWEAPTNSVVTGFDIQMRGSGVDQYSTLQEEPGSARVANISAPSTYQTYRLRVVPKALMTEGEPSTECKIGQSNGTVAAAIAAGIPSGLLFLLLLGGLVYLYVYCSAKKSQQPRYPVSRAAEKAITSQSVTAHTRMRRGGLGSPPDYNKTQQTPSERSAVLPTFAPPPPVRVATTV